jgi:hypothetical protein
VRCEWLEKGSVPGKKKKRPKMRRRENFCFIFQMELLFVTVLFFFVVIYKTSW